MKLEANNLVKKYKKRTVVKDVSVEVNQGEIVGLLGPNGAGKTTSFYMIVGLVRPNAGSIYLDGEDITRLPVYKRARKGLGYLAQEASVFRKLSVEDNIKAILEMSSMSKKEQHDRVEELLEEFSLTHVRKNMGMVLSGGERRRTEIARALAVNPKFVLLDEPFAGVDPIAVEEIQSIVAQLKSKNIGILITDHNVNETLSITDRAYLLFEGNILKAGSAEELAADEQVRKVYLGQHFELKKKKISTLVILNSIMTWVMKKRMHQIDLFLKYPHEVQQEWLEKLLNQARKTEWGKRYDFSSINSEKTFKERIPISSYEDIFPDIERIMKGEQNILWPTPLEWFAKSSGTTNDRSKFIPVTPEALEDCHYKGGKDMLSFYVNNYPDHDLFSGKSLSIGGSHQTNHLNPSMKYGDVSAVIMQNLPFWAQFIRTPKLSTALMDHWEEKIEKMARETMEENVTSLAGVPTWTIVLLQRILEISGKKDITEIWPNLELFAHGAVSFDPYRQIFQELIPSDKMNYLEVYNASEGFFGIQDYPGTGEMLLMLDYGIYYEFIPMDEWDNENPNALSLHEVELNRNYAMIITTNAGLWRYKIGDTIRFTSLEPYRIKITGRTKHFINAFGEEMIIENAEEAISYACQETGASIENYTAAPIYFEGNEKAGHEWLIEFKKAPQELERFTYLLDKKIREVNSDYDAKRYKDMALSMPLVHAVPENTFYNWLKKKGKLGGQNKVPRLCNDRKYIDDIKSMLQL